MPAGAWITVVRQRDADARAQDLEQQPVADDLAAYGRFRLSGGGPAELRGVPGGRALWRMGRRRG